MPGSRARRLPEGSRPGVPKADAPRADFGEVSRQENPRTKPPPIPILLADALPIGGCLLGVGLSAVGRAILVGSSVTR